MKKIFLLIMFFPIALIGQYGIPQINDLQHLNSVNPAMRLEEDSAKVKFLGFYVGKDDIEFQGSAIQNLAVCEYILPNTNILLGVEAGFSKYNFSFQPVIWNYDIHYVDVNPFLVSGYGNIELLKNLYAGTEVSFNAYRVNVQAESTIANRDTSYSFAENSVHTEIGLSYLPGNFIFAAGYVFGVSNNYSSYISLSSGYKAEFGNIEGLLLGTFRSSWYTIATARIKVSYKKKFDAALLFSGAISRLTSSTSNVIGVSAGMRFFQSSLKAGLGYNKYYYYWSLSPYLIWSF